MRTWALVRPVSAAMDRCELTHLARTPIDIERARAQHELYARRLESLGCTLIELPEAPDLPDSVFVEDAAVVLDEIAVITRPGAASRRAEVSAVAEALRVFRTLAHIEAPGTLDGGDVLRLGRALYIGRTPRSNDAGIAQLAALLEPHDYRVEPVPVAGCLHLKSAVTQVAEATLLINDACVLRSHWPQMSFVPVAEGEPQGANALRIGGTVLLPASAPATRARLEAVGIDVSPIENSEGEKAEGGVTCCSILFRGPSPVHAESAGPGLYSGRHDFH